MWNDTPNPQDKAPSNQAPIENIDSISTDEALAVRAITDDAQTILAGVTTEVPEQPIRTIIEKLDSSDNGKMAISRVIDIDVDTYWVIDDDGLTDQSSLFEDRPRIKRHSQDEPSDPPSCGIVVTNHHQIKLITPTPNGKGKFVKDYHPCLHGSVVDMQTGPLVNPAHMLPDEYDSK